MTRLSDRLNEAKPDVSIDAAIERARQKGLEVNRSQVYKALKGNHAKRPTDETLAGFGAVFGIPVTELRALVDAPSGELEPYTPPSYANRLNRDQRRALNNLIRTIVDSDDVAGGTVTPIRPAPDADDYSAVAFEGELETHTDFPET